MTDGSYQGSIFFEAEEDDFVDKNLGCIRILKNMKIKTVEVELPAP